MHTIILILAALLSLLASAAPLTPRAGGPVASPIPASCTVINPLPHANCSATEIHGYQVNATFNSTHHLYASYFDSFQNQTTVAKQCSEQCYGYGNTGDCKSFLLAFNVPTPAGYFGTAGGVLETACLLFDAYLDPNSFVAAPSGQYVNETAGSIYCPS